MSGPRRFKSLRRRVEVKNPKPKIVIYTEGEKTERDYFEAMKRAYHNAVVDIDIIEGAGVPLTIATKAARSAQESRSRNRRQSYAKRDEFWAVFDHDEHPRVAEAIRRCNEANVGVAYSNPCFELWLILHSEDFDRPDDHRAVQRHLENICDDYDRTRRKTTDCNRLVQSVVDAETRAERQLIRRNGEGIPPRRPFTRVYELTRRIRGV